MPSAPATLYVIDTLALIFRMFHAIPMMTAPGGRPVNAVFGVSRDLITIVEETKPTYLVCAFDLPGPTFREEFFPEYKQNRDPPPDDLVQQIPMVEAVVRAMNIPVLGVPGFEADDVMATVARAGAERGIEVTICTSDKDCRQLINDRVRLYDTKKKKVLDRAFVLEDWGITPEQVIDFQTLVGDSVDNVPGVTGIGEKTAAKLLQQYGTIEKLVAAVDEIKQPKMRENLKKAVSAGDLDRSRRLVTLDTRVPLSLDWDQWKLRPWNGTELLALFEEYQFRSFSVKVRSSLKSAGQAKNREMLESIGEAKSMHATKPRQGSLFDDLAADAAGESDDPDDFPVGVGVPAAPSVAPGSRSAGTSNPSGSVDPSDPSALASPPTAAAVDDWNATYHLVDTPKAFADFLKKLKKAKRFAVDLETTGLDSLRCDIVGWAICFDPKEGYYLPVRGPAGSKLLDAEQVIAGLRPLLEDATIEKVNQNIKYDLLVMRSHGIHLAGIAGDSMIAHYLLHSGDRSHGLDELTRKFFRHENISITELIGKGKNQKSMAEVPTDRIADYAAEDAVAALRLVDRLEPELPGFGVRPVYDDVEIPLISVLASMEATGIRLDSAYLRELSQTMTGRVAELETEIHQSVGREFNIASLKQLREVLYGELALPVLKRTGVGNEPSTDQETLEKLAALGHTVPVKLMEHRRISKLLGTYVDALPELVNPKTGRIHSSFNQTVAATGRLSSSDPNLQNIPARTDLGQEIRKAFIPREGWLLLTADYSQIELRMLAHFSGDRNLQRAYAENRDIHTMVAAEIYGVAESAVTSDMRRTAKTVNFGVIYGMSAHGLAERLGIERRKAEQFIEEYFDRYPGVSEYQDRLLSSARTNGYVASILGRRRRFDPHLIRPRTNYHGRNQAEREAINMEIQASAADLIKRAMINIDRRLKAENRSTAMLLSVHDELVFEVPPAERDEITKLVGDEMRGAMSLAVPLEVEIAVGKNWLEVE